MRISAGVFMTADGTRKRLSPVGGFHYQPSIDASGSRVVWFGGTEGPPRIWTIEPEGRARAEPLTATESGARHGCISVSGGRLAFVSDRDSPIPGEPVEEMSSLTRNVRPGVHLNLFVANPDGSGATQVTDGPWQDLRPTFSPDENTLAFVSNRVTSEQQRAREQPTLWTVNVDGREPPTPLHTPSWAYRPSYTSDGRSIVYYGPDRDRHRLFVLDLTDAAVRPLCSDDRGITHGPFVDIHGEEVLAHSTRGGSTNLWAFAWEGKGVRPLLKSGEGPASHPVRAGTGLLVFDVIGA